MNKINRIIVVLLILFMLVGCSTTKSLLKNKIESKNIDKVQIVLAEGNPQYGAKSKIILDRSEIYNFVECFNNAKIYKKVEDGDIVDADTSEYYFYSKDKIIKKFVFNGNNPKRIWHDSAWYQIKYEGKSPYGLYSSSKAEVTTIDKEWDEPSSHIKRVSSDQVKLIKAHMKYDDIIKLLGDTRDIGSGIYILEYIVDKDKILRISFMNMDSPCGKSGEELLETVSSLKTLDIEMRKVIRSINNTALSKLYKFTSGFMFTHSPKDIIIKIAYRTD